MAIYSGLYPLVAPSSRIRSRQRGLALVLVMTVLLMASAGLLIAYAPIKLERHRQKEKELLFVGNQIKSAIQNYAISNQAGVVQFPRALTDLLEDQRGQVTRRYLRKVFRDPITNSSDWGLVMVDDHIIGVYSKSRRAPIKKSGFRLDQQAFENAKDYSEWQFVAKIN
jgi:type II secretory pathway pseudopilin PulG